METFPLFSDLPTELQLQVVEQTRPQPGVHFFSVHGGHQNDPSFQQLPHSDLRIGEWSTRAGLDRVLFRFTLAAPSFNSAAPGVLSWTDSNPSTYLVDSGLMTASRRTRALMDKVYGLERTRTKIADIREKHRGELDGPDDGVSKPLANGQLSPEEASELGNAPTVATIKIDGQAQDILLFPGRDLICFQPRTTTVLDTINFTRLFFAAIFDPRVTPGDDPNCGRFQIPPGNVAFECDPFRLRGVTSHSTVMTDSYYGGGAETVFNWFRTFFWALNLDDQPWIKRFWFIDYRIRRQRGAPRLGHDIQQFHGNGCKFVEVDHFDRNWEIDEDIFACIRGRSDIRGRLGVLARVLPEA
jgi:hypothetical protein